MAPLSCSTVQNQDYSSLSYSRSSGHLSKQKWQFWRIRQSTVEWSDFWKTNLGTLQVVVNCFGTQNPKFYLKSVALSEPYKASENP